MMNKAESGRYKGFWESQTAPLHAHHDSVWFDRYAAEIKSFLPNSGIVVDAGCGSGEILSRLARFYNEMIGIDYSASMLERAREQVADWPGVSLHIGSITEIKSFCPQRVDAIYCNGVVQYLGQEELRKFVKESLEILPSQGRLVVLQVPNINCRTLFRLGFYKHEQPVPFSSILKGLVTLYGKQILSGKRDDGIGNWYSIEEMKQLAKSLNASAEVYGSSFVNYYYRFHAIITKN